MVHFTLNCQDFEEVGLGRGCCSTCHEDEWEGYYDLPEVDPPPRANGHVSPVTAFVCCRYCSDLTRDEFAKALWAKRKRARIEYHSH